MISTFKKWLKKPLRNIRQIKRWLNHAEFIDTALDHAEFVDAALEAKIHRDRLEQAFAEEFAAFESLSTRARRSLPLIWQDRYLCLDDKTSETSFDRHYIYHPAWAARILAKTRPNRHVDISSTLYFCSIVSAFVPVDFYDSRPAELRLTGLTTGAADLTRLPFSDSSIHSLSCMHVLEHIGLGRYGDRHDPNGDLRAIQELIRVLGSGGNLLVVVPVGRSRIMFNAHRVYDFQEFREYFNGLTLVEFALIPDGKMPDGLVYNPPSELVNQQQYGCGCYWFKK